MSETSESGSRPEKSLAAWGQVGVVLLTEYDHYARLKKLAAEVQSALALFTTLGFDVLDAGTLRGDGRGSSVQKAIGVWQPAGQRLIIYWAGHGKVIDSGALFLCSRDTAGNRLPEAYDSVPASVLGDLLAGKDVSEIVLLLDACGAGGGAAEIVARFRAKVNSRSYLHGFKPGLAVISSAGRYQFAREGAFSSALVSVLRDGPPADPSYLPWTERDEYITPVELFKAIRVHLARPAARGSVQAPDYDETGGVGRFFPNPRYNRQIPDVGVAEKQRRAALLPSAVAEHFMLKFRGIDTVDDRGWFFTGRERLLRRLAWWLGSRQSGLLVLTGPPGCGKSAVLGRLAVLSVPEYRARVKEAGGLQNVPADTIPPKRSIDAGVHAKNLGLTECIAELADALGLPAPAAGWRSAADFVRQVASLKRPVTLLLDALDEAQPEDIHAMAADLVQPLSELPRLKILVGTRPDRASREEAGNSPAEGGLLHALGATGQQIIWLDRDEDAPADIKAYAQQRLISTAGSPYWNRPDLAAVAAGIIAQRSDRVFLIARLLTQELIRRDKVLALTGSGHGDGDAWNLVEGSLAAAFTADLTRYGKDEWRLRALLAPLAFAEGAGLPSRDVWLTMAEALRPPAAAASRAPLTAADLSWLVGKAGAYLIESGEDGQTVYRLYHQAFADYFRRAVPLTAAGSQARITDALLSQVPSDSGRRYWKLANPYTLRHLATHAIAAGRLAGLASDSRYLLYADPQKLQRALGSLADLGHPLVRLYLRCVDSFPQASTSERAAIMQGAALRDEPEAQALLSTEPELPWRGLWSTGRRSAFHRRLPSHASPVTAVAFGQTGRTTLLATAAGDGVVRLWNAATGEQWCRFDSRSGTVFTLTFCPAGRHQVLVTGGTDGTVKFWNPDSGRLVRSLNAHDGPVFAAVAVQTDGQTGSAPLLATAGEDGYIRLWDPGTGTKRGALIGHHMPVRALAYGTDSHGPILISGGDDGRVRIWDPGQLRQLRQFSGMGWIYATAFGRVGGRPVLATGSAFGTLRLWDLTTYAHLASFTGHHGAVGTVAFGVLDGRPLLTTGGDDGAIRLWDPRSGSLEHTFTRSTPLHATRSADAPARAALALGATPSATAEPDSSPEDVVTGVGRGQSVQALAWGAVAGKPILASGDADWLARLWEPVVSGTTDQDLHSGQVLSLSAGRAYGYPIVVEGCQNGAVRLRDAGTGRLLRRLEYHRRPVAAVTTGYIDERPVIASAGASGIVAVHDAMNGQVMLELDVRVTKAPDTAEAVVIADLAGHPVVVTGSGYGSVALWDARSAAKIRDVQSYRHSKGLALGYIDGRPVLISGKLRGGVVVTELLSDQVTDLPGHQERVLAAAFGYLAGRPIAATASADQTIRIWDLTAAGELFVLGKDLGTTTHALAFGYIGGHPVLLSGGDDRAVRLWDPGDGRSLGLLADHAIAVAAIATSEDADGQLLAWTGAEDGTHAIRLSPAILKPADPGPAAPVTNDNQPA